MVTGLGRAVGGTSDLVVLWSPGSASFLDRVARVVCMAARRVTEEALGATLATAVALGAVRATSAPLWASRAPARVGACRRTRVAIQAEIRREC